MRKPDAAVFVDVVPVEDNARSRQRIDIGRYSLVKPRPRVAVKSYAMGGGGSRVDVSIRTILTTTILTNILSGECMREESKEEGRKIEVRAKKKSPPPRRSRPIAKDKTLTACPQSSTSMYTI